MTLLSIFLFVSCNYNSSNNFSIVIEQEKEKDIEIFSFSEEIKQNIDTTINKNGFKANIRIKTINESLDVKVNILSDNEKKVYLSLQKKFHEEEVWNFNGIVNRTEIYRQSPHDLNAWITDSLAKQAMPMFAIKKDNKFIVALSSSPANYNNYTTQYFDLKNKTLKISSGDNGLTPGMKPETMKMFEYNAENGQIFTPGNVTSYFHKVNKEQSHEFSFILLSSEGENLNDLRKDIISKSAYIFSNGKYNDYMGLCH